MIKKKLLIIGGSKFIGKSFISYFNSNTNYLNLEIKLILRNFFNKKIYNKNIKIINKDFKKIKSLPECDFILYCLRTNSIKNDNELFQVFQKKIHKLRKKPKIIYTGSGVLYGLNKEKIKISEKFDVVKQFSKSQKYKQKWFSQKLNLERKFYELSKENYKIIVLRMFTFIGPNILDQNYAISKFYKKIKYNKKIIINGPINTYRSYLDEIDTVEWILKILFNFKNNFEIYNFGSDKAIRIYDLVIRMVGKINIKKIVLINKSSKLDYYVPSISKLKKRFNVKQKVSLNKSIKKLFLK